MADLFDIVVARKLSGGGGGDSWTVLTEETVTTSAMGPMYGGTLSYSQLIDADTIKVTFDGTEYECTCVDGRESYNYGGVGETGPDFSEYPFCISSALHPQTGEPMSQLFTETAGAYTIKIEAPQGGSSSDFSTATIAVTIPSGNETEISIPEVGVTALEVQLVTEYNSPFSATVPLYKGVLTIEPHLIDGQVTIVGDGEYSSAGIITITGDCTITIS